MIRKLAGFVLASILILLLAATPAYAFLTNFIDIGFATYNSNLIKVFRNLAEPGDSLWMFMYDIPFASDNLTPVEPASDTIVFKLYDSSGNLTATFNPYVYPYLDNNGYSVGVASIYFAAGDYCPAWGSAAVLEMQGWPTYFSGAPTFSYTLTVNDYTTAVTQDDNRTELKKLVLLWADRMNALYADTGVVLKASSDSGEVLSSEGETYFSGAIPKLSTLCPDLFFIQVYIPERLPVSYNMTMADYYKNRADTSHWNEGFTNLGAGIGVSGGVFTVLLWAVATIVICIVCIRKDWGIEAGLGISAFVGVMGGIMLGGVMFAIMMILSLLAVIALIWINALKRVS